MDHLIDLLALDRAIDANAETAFGFLERLVAQASTVGQEQGALEVFASELLEPGFEVERMAGARTLARFLLAWSAGDIPAWGPIDP